METERNIISSEAKLSAVAWVMFFAPFVNNRIKEESDFTEWEKSFIKWYVQVWYINLIFLIINILTALLYTSRDNFILYWIMTISSFAVFIISVFSLFACANDLSMRKEDEAIMQNIQNKWQLLKSYTPIINFVLWFRQGNYNVPYRRLKESILLRTFFIFWTLLLGNSFWLWILIIIFVRIILLLLNIDIVPMSMKKGLNSLFSCNPSEMVAYIFAPIVSKIKNVDYETVLKARKLWYFQWQNFWIWIIIQYVLFWGLMFLLYRDIIISTDQILLFIAIVLWIIRIVIFYVNKKTILKIPIFSELVSLVFI